MVARPSPAPPSTAAVRRSWPPSSRRGAGSGGRTRRSRRPRCATRTWPSSGRGSATSSMTSRSLPHDARPHGVPLRSEDRGTETAASLPWRPQCPTPARHRAPWRPSLLPRPRPGSTAPGSPRPRRRSVHRPAAGPRAGHGAKPGSVHLGGRTVVDGPLGLGAPSRGADRGRRRHHRRGGPDGARPAPPPRRGHVVLGIRRDRRHRRPPRLGRGGGRRGGLLGSVPVLAAVTGPAISGPALLLGLADVAVMTPDAFAFLSGPDAVEGFTGMRVSLHDLGGSAMHATRQRALRAAGARRVPTCSDWSAPCSPISPTTPTPSRRRIGTDDPPSASAPELREMIPTSSTASYDVRDIIARRGRRRRDPRAPAHVGAPARDGTDQRGRHARRGGGQPTPRPGRDARHPGVAEGRPASCASAMPSTSPS